MFKDVPVIPISIGKLNESPWKQIKRTGDVLLSLSLIIFVFSWLWPIIIFSIKLSSRGNVFFKQERFGKNNRKFVVYKFRTLCENSLQFDTCGTFLQVTKDDPRVTAIGRILRRTNLDELPQFLNILKGDMSLIGPRPHLSVMDLQFKDKISNYMLRYSVRPGITGWAQVNGFRGETKDPYFMQKRVEHDLWYIENWSLGLDIYIIFLTILKMLKGDPNAY
jgi:putative colanic acid biosynthesis UDP-glucose lipid carrier transferase